MLNPSSASLTGGSLGPDASNSPPSSPKRNAAFSRLAPDVGRLVDFKNGDEDFGVVVVVVVSVELVGVSGCSNIHCKHRELANYHL